MVCAKLWFSVGDLGRRVEWLEQTFLAGCADAFPESWEEPSKEITLAEPSSEPLATTPPLIDLIPDVALPDPGEPDEHRQFAIPRIGFEQLFGRTLPIWAGGATLAVAGFLIVKYSIEIGLLRSVVRVILGVMFGTSLIVGAEVAMRKDDVVRDPRVRQALAGAGVATLYASILIAANLYHLIGPIPAFVGMAITTALAGGLSMQLGAPSAVLGLVGGLAAPALVGSTTPDVPLLSAYLALAVAGLCGRSVLLILLALAFLGHGIQSAKRDWRIASLVLMLAAVTKVFLSDASGLDGVMRIGSFAALGFSLIGLGWPYARYLPDASRLTKDSGLPPIAVEGE